MLRAMSRVLRDSIRETDTAARVGGDEFALVLPDTDHRGAQQVIAKLTSGLQQALGAMRGVTCGIGVATFLDSTISPESAVATADKLMYEVKQRSKGAVAFSVLEEGARLRTAASVRVQT